MAGQTPERSARWGEKEQQEQIMTKSTTKSTTNQKIMVHMRARNLDRTSTTSFISFSAMATI